MSNYVIRTMNRDEIDIAVDWAASEGWNPGLNDADCYAAADPNGFFVGLLDYKPIATISAIKYGNTFGFIGFYIVKSEFRGKGYGIQIWNAGINYLRGLNIGLDGVVDQQENYRKSGFKLAYRNIRYMGSGGGTPPNHSGIVDLLSIPFDLIIDYDRSFFPSNRSQFTWKWIRQSNGHALGILENGKLAGYGVIRQCRMGHKIGPLFADTPELAESLFTALKCRVGLNEPVYLDTPEMNPAALAIAERHGMQVCFETARMYTGTVPGLPINRLFGVTSFEIG